MKIMKGEILNTVERQELFNELMNRIKQISELPMIQQLRAILDLENYIAEIYEKGYKDGFEKGKISKFNLGKN